jgi:hypothetical protein
MNEQYYETKWWFRLLKVLYVGCYIIGFITVLFLYAMINNVPVFHRQLICNNTNTFTINQLDITGIQKVPSNVPYNFICNYYNSNLNSGQTINVGAEFLNYLSGSFAESNYSKDYLVYIFSNLDSTTRNSVLTTMQAISTPATANQPFDYNALPDNLLNSLALVSYNYVVQYNKHLADNGSNSQLPIDISNIPNFTISNPISGWLEWFFYLILTSYIFTLLMKGIRFSFRYIAFGEKFRFKEFFISWF